MVQTLRQVLIINGAASQKEIKKILIPDEFEKNLSVMEFLISNSITIASSCSGVGSCKKCIINENILSCQITLKEFISDNLQSIIEVSYL